MTLSSPGVSFAQLARWDRPIGTWLLLWPCAWSVALAAPPGAPPDLGPCALFGVGAFAMRGAGCTINDLWDRDIDRQVERTKLRPLASGALTPMVGAAIPLAEAARAHVEVIEPSSGGKVGNIVLVVREEE